MLTQEWENYQKGGQYEKIWKQLISISMSLIMALGSNVVMTQTAYADEETGTETK